MLLSFGSAVTSLVWSFFREIFMANPASPPPETEPTMINPTVDKQNGHMAHLTFLSSRFLHRAVCESIPDRASRSFRDAGLPEDCELAFKSLGYAGAPSLGDGLRDGIREDIVFAFFQAIEDTLSRCFR